MESSPCWSSTDALARAPPSDDPGARIRWIAVVLAVGDNAHRGVQQFAQANERRDVRPITTRQKRAIGSFFETQRALARDVTDAQQEIHFAQAARCAPFCLRAAALVTLDQIAAPAIGRGIAERTEQGSLTVTTVTKRFNVH